MDGQASHWQPGPKTTQLSAELAILVSFHAITRSWPDSEISGSQGRGTAFPRLASGCYEPSGKSTPFCPWKLSRFPPKIGCADGFQCPKPPNGPKTTFIAMLVRLTHPSFPSGTLPTFLSPPKPHSRFPDFNPAAFLS